ncbi:4'-phosphopantetheinyl transferase superfamily protein [Streptomyces sp. NBC_01387]|uniref:4'-phosphopantetheinyl transferase family protein n=1 Tax=unclassified Streptomyces TaxID=2593676 RepID=UPI002E15A4C6|nr:4'-phosphopantetheinyl transferase superfamily protein [Streptomyces sp. NBC_01197]WSS47254.1 4'-phosphopantetheinyl transferase superfamily protein [Streptomyces sp. NBC_01180]
MPDTGAPAGRAGGLRGLVPARVAVQETYEDLDDGTGLFPEEREAVAGVVDERRREFSTVRVCARRALAELGVPAVPLLPGPGGAPRWPTGVTGSMTHCAGYRAGVVARLRDASALGIDAEPHEALPPLVADRITSPTERNRARLLRDQSPHVHWDRLMFCAKESVFKALHVLTGHSVGFTDSDITLRTDGTFTAGLGDPLPVRGGDPIARCDGRWTVQGSYLLAAVVVPG